MFFSPPFLWQMQRILAIVLWCFLQVEGRRPEVLSGSSDNGHFLDNDKWLTTVSQYDREKYWNKFRDVSAPRCSLLGNRGGGVGGDACLWYQRIVL